jgi:TolB-like protein
MFCMLRIGVVLAMTACLATYGRSAPPRTGPGATVGQNEVYLSDLKPAAVCGRTYEPGTGYTASLFAAGTCMLNGEAYRHSLSVANSGFYKNGQSEDRYGGSVTYLINKQYAVFEADAGVSDEYPNEGLVVRFQVKKDGEWTDETESVHAGQAPVHISVSVQGITRLTLYVATGNDRNGNGFGRVSEFASKDVWWGNARLTRHIRSIIERPVGPTTRSDSGTTPTDTGSPGTPEPVSADGKILPIGPEQLKGMTESIVSDARAELDLFKDKPTLAIAAIRLISRPGEALAAANADNLREDLRTALVKTKLFTVVERGQLDEILRQNKIELKDTFDSETAKKLGQLLKARFFLIGSLSDRGSSTVINVSIIDSVTGAAAIAENISIPLQPAVTPLQGG